MIVDSRAAAPSNSLNIVTVDIHFEILTTRTKRNDVAKGVAKSEMVKLTTVVSKPKAMTSHDITMVPSGLFSQT